MRTILIAVLTDGVPSTPFTSPSIAVIWANEVRACLLALTSFAQITAIEGDVKGVDGTPSVNTAIKIVRIDIKGNYPCKTNKKGHFFYNGLPPGTYNVSVEIDGKEMDIVRGIDSAAARWVGAGQAGAGGAGGRGAGAGWRPGAAAPPAAPARAPAAV